MFSCTEAGRILVCGTSMSRDQSMTAEQYKLYKKIGDSNEFFFQKQSKEEKLMIRALVRRNLVAIDEKGFVYQLELKNGKNNRA